MARTHRPMVTSLLAGALSVGCAGDAPAPTPASPYLQGAIAASAWIDSVAVATAAGLVWPADPAQPDALPAHLYSGSPGVVLFLLDLYAATADQRTLDAALAGAAALAAQLPETDAEVASGLYTGLAGQCVTLARAHEIAREERYLTAARRCVAAVRQRAVRAGGGAEWTPVTDIIGGSAGIGLMLLWAAEELDDAAALELAVDAGARLLELALEAPPGSKWAMAPGFERLMPNFSHGTAGIAYFLARLYEVTGEQRFLDGALAGARYLQSVAETEGDMCMVFHHEPEGEDLFYLSWCHGPAGTGRTFYQLYRVTGEPAWLEWTHRAATAILTSGIPAQRTPGFWNNVSRCCGSAGVIEFFLDLHGISGEARYRAFALQVADDLLRRATTDAAGMRWVQAEHRAQPDNLAAQTGYMQGASGIGSTLLYLHAVEYGGPPPVVLPDSPFSGAAAEGR